MMYIGDLHVEVIGKRRRCGCFCRRHSLGHHAFDLFADKLRGLCQNAVAVAGFGRYGQQAGYGARRSRAHPLVAAGE